MPRHLIGKSIKSYNITKQLGAGAFAVVFQGVDTTNNSLVAIKVLKISQLNKVTKLKQLCQTQIAVLKSCHNNNVIRYVDSFQTTQFRFIVTQFCNGGDLQEYIKKQKNLTQNVSVSFLKEILNGFKGLHQVGAMHRDFKAANVLLHDGQCKIADLGFSKQLQQNKMAKTIIGTSLTMAPQVLEQKPYGFEVDIWSIGVVFYHMIYGKYPYNGKNDYALLKMIKQCRPRYDEVNISEQTRDFIDKCLTVDPKKRISWKQIYEHPLIIEMQRGFITTGIIRSDLSLKTNKSFYESLPSSGIQSLDKSCKQIILQVLPDNDLRVTNNLSSDQKQVVNIKLKEQQLSRLQNLYTGRRNDIMLFTIFIDPHLKKISNIRVNHSVAGFIMTKKVYFDLVKLQQSLVNKKNLFTGQSRFQEFCQQESYKKFVDLIKLDVIALKKKAEQFKSFIRLTTLQIKQQYDMKTIKNSNFKQLHNDIIHSYSKLLTQALTYVKGQIKKDLLSVIYALKYLWNNQKPIASQYDKLLSTQNLAQFEKSLTEKQTNFHMK